jgi:signal transduction histidine kinase
VELKGSPIYEDEEITGGWCWPDDITSQRQMEMDMARLGQMHLVGEMAVSIGHEIRNPMTTVQGFLQILESKS